MGGHPTAKTKSMSSFARTFSYTFLFFRKKKKSTRPTHQRHNESHRMRMKHTQKMGGALWVGTIYLDFVYKVNRTHFHCAYSSVVFSISESSHLTVPGDFLSGQRMMKRFFIVGRGRGEGYWRHSGQHIRNPPKKQRDAHGTHTHTFTCQQNTIRHTGKQERQKTLATVKESNELSPPKKYKRHATLCTLCASVCKVVAGLAKLREYRPARTTDSK